MEHSNLNEHPTYLQATLTSFALICTGLTGVSDAEEADARFAGKHQGAGPISFAPDAQPLQLTWSGNVALRLQTRTAKERVEDLLWDMNVFLRAEASTEAKAVIMDIFWDYTAQQSSAPPRTRDRRRTCDDPGGHLTPLKNEMALAAQGRAFEPVYRAKGYPFLDDIETNARRGSWSPSLCTVPGSEFPQKFGGWQFGFDLGQPIEDIEIPLNDDEVSKRVD